MTTDLIEHATRLLERESTRCMGGEPLCARTRRDTGACISLEAFLALLERRPDRFMVIRTEPVMLDEADWILAGRAAYAATLAAVRSSAHLVMLADRPADEAASLTGNDRLLADVHAALADLLHAPDMDDSLRRAANQAVQEMQVIRSGMEQCS